MRAGGRLIEGMGQAEVDAAAVARVRSGETDAFRVLVERHTNAVYRLACRMTGNAHDAEDVVQETFLRAFKRLDDFEARAQFGSWLHRIAANCSYDLLRARAREQARRLPAENDEGEPIEHTVASPAPGPERLAAGSELRRRVQAAMQRMSALERAAFTLRHLEGRSIAEIEQALGLDTSAAKQSIFRAVRKVRQTLGACEARGEAAKA
jgi:RNA polymerase sigma-70 factor (ECF subfamily)